MMEIGWGNFSRHHWEVGNFIKICMVKKCSKIFHFINYQKQPRVTSPIQGVPRCVPDTENLASYPASSLPP